MPRRRSSVPPQPIIRLWNRQINPLSRYAQGNLRGIQGAGNEQLVAARALKHGFIVFFRMWSDTKYDMVIECENELFRVQVKGTQGNTIGVVGGLRGGIQRPANKPYRYTRDDCDIIIAVDSNTGDCFVFPIDYIIALNKTTVNLNQSRAFLERWDYIAGNSYLDISQCRNGIGLAQLQNKVRTILPSAPSSSDLNELRKTFYTNCPKP